MTDEEKQQRKYNAMIAEATLMRSGDHIDLLSAQVVVLMQHIAALEVAAEKGTG